ncbi:MAG: hypothetical protein ACOCUI_04340 [bacterium]
MELPTEFFTIETLASFAGLVAATYIFVAFFKKYLKKLIGDIAIRPFAVIVAFSIQMFVFYVQNDLVIETIGLAIINSILVALTAMGVHENVDDPKADKVKIDPKKYPFVNQYKKEE